MSTTIQLQTAIRNNQSLKNHTFERKQLQTKIDCNDAEKP